MKAGADRVLFLVSDSGAYGAGREIALLAKGLAERGYGVEVSPVSIRGLLDFSGLRRLARIVARFEPDIVHTFGPLSARLLPLLRVLSGSRRFRTIASDAAETSGGLRAWATAQAVRRADRVVAATWSQGNRYRRMGVPAERLVRIAPGVAAPASPPDREAFCRELGLPTGARFIVTAGRLESGAAMKAAVWAFDLLRYEFPDLFLLIFGDGPGRAAIERFGRSLAFDDFRVRFPGDHAELPALLGLAEAVWATGGDGSVHLALEAMAAGRPVVGFHSQGLAEIVEDGVTGSVAESGDRFQLAARTNVLLCDPLLRSKQGAAGRARALDSFSIGRMIGLFSRLYEEVVGRHQSGGTLQISPPSRLT